jgi:hypothetical protein
MMSKKPEDFVPNGYNPSTGIYASSYIFTGDWEDELKSLEYTSRGKTFADADGLEEKDDDKGLFTGYLYNSFKSHNGDSKQHDVLYDSFWTENNPAEFSYTDSYYKCPKIASILDWFQCETSQIRVFQQQPGHKMPLHTDWDNQKGTQYGETVRIFLQLTDMPGGAWFHFRTADSQVHINLQKGQFLIFNPDHTAHGTENLTNIPRNTIMIVAKRNEWLDNIINNETMQFIDIDNLVQQKVAA